MISIRYYATEDVKLQYGMTTDETAPILSTFGAVEDKIKNNAEIINYATLWGEGIKLYDKSVIMANTSDYLGYIMNDSDPRDIVLDFNEFSLAEPPKFENGITVIFGKVPCGKIQVLRGGVVYGEALTEGKLKVNIPLDSMPRNWDNITIRLSEMPVDAYADLKGIALGKVGEITEFFDYNHITEINPIGDDLPMNEVNATAEITEDVEVNYGQKAELIDNGKVIETDVIVDFVETDDDFYKIKLRNTLENLDKIQVQQTGRYGDDKWLKLIISQVAPLVLPPNYSVKIQEGNDKYVSPFLKKCSGRKWLQQMSWGAFSGIKMNDNEIQFVNFRADVKPEVLTISNSDDRIIKTSVRKGTVYKTILWDTPEIVPDDKAENTEAFTISRKGKEFIENEYTYELDEPLCRVVKAEGQFGLGVRQTNPYEIKILIDGSIPIQPDYVYTIKVLGTKYKKLKRVFEIPTGNAEGETLTISKQEIYNYGKCSDKRAQLGKWYKDNNTLYATLANEQNDLEVGKFVKIQLKKGNFFTGIITKLVRNSVSNYNAVEIEVHQWTI